MPSPPCHSEQREESRLPLGGKLRVSGDEGSPPYNSPHPSAPRPPSPEGEGFFAPRHSEPSPTLSFRTQYPVILSNAKNLGFPLGTRMDFSKQRTSAVLPSEMSKSIYCVCGARGNRFPYGCRDSCHAVTDEGFLSIQFPSSVRSASTFPRGGRLFCASSFRAFPHPVIPNAISCHSEQREESRLPLGDEDGFLKTADIRCFAVRDEQKHILRLRCPRQPFSLRLPRQLSRSD